MKMLKRFIAYYAPHKKLFALDMLASLLISLVGILYPIFTRLLLNDYFPNAQYGKIVTAGLILLGLYGIRYGLRYFVQYYGHQIGVQMQSAMRRDLFRHLQTLPFTFFDEHETGKIMSRMTNDLWEVSELAHHGPENLIVCTITILGAVIYLSTINLTLTAIIAVCVPVLYFVSRTARKKMTAAFKERRASQAVINAAIESSITGIRVTKAFNNSRKEEEKFEVGNKQLEESFRKGYIAMAQFFSSTQFVTDVFNVVVLMAGGIFLCLNKINLADYSAFIVSIGMFTGPVSTLIGFMEQYQTGATGFQRFCEIMDVPSEKEREGAKDVGTLNGALDLDHVSFRYSPESREILHDVSLHLQPGKTLALVGASGGGKTTICHLIPRFYPLTEGSISVDGIDVRDMTAESLRRNVGIVQQDVFLFNGTIRENILYGRLDATDEEVIEAAKRANIHEFVMTLPEGYDSQVGERGVKLSGGQKQRISIARVFLKDPSILILDEATSALDTTTEIMIQQALDELRKGRTTIVVAHRLSTIKNADEIAVITRGVVEERGTHAELLEKNGRYAELYQMQFRRDGAEPART